jgi:CubicO group peptidase (beta-lactamase class C family)
MTAPLKDPVTAHADYGLTAIPSRHPAVGLAVGVVQDGRLDLFHGHGLADIVSRTPVTEDTVFRIGSITKTFTAVAVLQLCEQGLVDLDAPVGGYLRAYCLIPAKPGHRPPTIRQLLTHTAGLPQLVYPARAFQPVLGETVAYGQRVPALAEFYRGRLHLIAEPGTRHTYSNHGFATLGQIVEDITGQPLRAYFREHIFGPLGMTDTDLARSDRVSARLATGYTLRAGGPRPVRDCDLVTVGAGGIYSTTADMARYVAALLAGGSGEHGPILKPETVTSIFAPHYQPDPRLPGVGLGFFRHNLGGHLVAGHDGLVPGFISQLSLAPHDGTGVMAFTNGARGAMAWLGAEASAILGRILGVPDPVIRADVPHRPEVWTEVCGWYSFRVAARRAEVVRRRGGGLRPARPAHAPARHPGARAGPRAAAAPGRRRRSLRVPDRPVRPRHRHQPGGVQPVTARRSDGVPPRPRRRPAVVRQAAGHQGPAVLGHWRARRGCRSHHRERRPAARAVRAAASPRPRSCRGSRRDARPPAA